NTTFAHHQRFGSSVGQMEGVHAHTASFRRDEVDSIVDPLRIRVHASHSNIGVQGGGEVEVHGVQAVQRVGPVRADGPKVDVGGEAPRKVVSQEGKGPVVRRPAHGRNLQGVPRELI